MFIYGTESFSKHLGYFGTPTTCPSCGNRYSMSYVRIRKWAHVDYIPLFPVKSVYFKMCPICTAGVEMKGKDAKAEMKTLERNSAQRLEYYGKHILKDKPKGIFKTDFSYEMWVRDCATGETVCIGNRLDYDKLKKMKKTRGIKKLPIEKVKD